MKKKIKSTIAAATIALGCTLTAAPASACDSLLYDAKLASDIYDATGIVGFRELAFTIWQTYQACERYKSLDNSDTIKD